MFKITATFNSFMICLDQHKSKFDFLCAILLAIIPILQHYVGIVDNASTTLLVIMVPYLFLSLIPKFNHLKLTNISVVLVLIIFFLYKLIDHGTYFIEIAQVGLVIIYFLAVALDCIDIKRITKTAGIIAGIAGVSLIVQYFCFYVLGFHLQLVPTSLLLAESDAWILGAQTGLVGVNGAVSSLYRPSAFFLEPSHLFLYSFPLLFINLFETKKNKNNVILSILISIGMVLCTSGMGIAVVAGAWGLFFALWNEEECSFKIQNITRKRNMIFIGTLLIIAILLFVFVPFIRESVMRIFVNKTGSTAISGRTEESIKILKQMNFRQWIIGVSDSTASISFNMPGFMATAYKYGIIGILLSYEFYVKCFCKLNISYFLVSAIIIVVSFFSAHTHGTFFMIYYVLLLMEGYKTTKSSWLNELYTNLKIFLFKKKI